MNPIAYLMTAIVAVALGACGNGAKAPLHAQADCADWNTEAFFEAAEVSDVTRCLQAGMAPEARAEWRLTPLHWAAHFGNAEAIGALATAGANLEARSESGFTPLHEAAYFGKAETIEALLRAGADPKALTTAGKLPFDLIKDNEQLKRTDGYWKLNQARFE